MARGGMSFMDILGDVGDVAQGYARQQQRNQEQQSNMMRQLAFMAQFQQQQRQRQQQQNIAPILRGLAGSGALNLAPLAALPQGTGGGGGMPGGGMPSPSPGPTNLMAPMSADQAAAMVPIINRDESGNRNIPNQQGPGGTPASSASGPAQFINSTWREMAPRAGVDVSRYPTAMSAGGPPGSPATPTQNAVTQQTLQARGLSPWASNPKVVQDVYGQMEQSGVNPPQIPPPPGGFDIATLAHAIEKTNPGIDDETFVAALDSASALMSRGTQQQWRQYQQVREAQDAQKHIDIDQGNAAERARHDRAMEGKAAAGGGGGFPEKVALQKYMEEHPDATGEDIQSFIQSGRSVRSGPAMAAQAYLREHPNATADDIKNFVAQTAAQVSSTRAFDVGTQGNTVRSLNVAIQHLSTLQDAANALNNKDLRSFNRLANAIATETGQAAPTDFNATKGIVKDEVVKAILGGVGALGDRQEVEKTIDAANSPEQLAGVVRRYEQLMGGQMSGLQQQFVTSGVGDEGAFQKKLLPRTVDALKRAKTGEGGQKYTVGQIIDTPKGKMKVTGGDLNGDPDVEPVK